MTVVVAADQMKRSGVCARGGIVWRTQVFCVNLKFMAL